MKRFKKSIVTFLLVTCIAFSVACKMGNLTSSSDSSLGSSVVSSSQSSIEQSSFNSAFSESSSTSQSSTSSNVDGGSEKTVVNFWYDGNNNQQLTYLNLVREFNRTIGKENNVEIKPTAYTDLDSYLHSRIGTSSCPDVFYLEDKYYKEYADKGYLLDVANYVENSTSVSFDDMWDSYYDRYYYSTTNHLAGDNADQNGSWYGIPKNVAPSVLFYNEKLLALRGDVFIMSVSEENLEDFNNGLISDDKGKSKDDYGFASDYVVPAKGYFTYQDNKYFNNQIAMSWDELKVFAKSMCGTDTYSGTTYYGYYDSWWYNFCWSVGGDAIQYINAEDYTTYDGGGYYDFTLVDDTKNYMVKEEIVINGTTYKVGEIVSYSDKLQNEVELAEKENKHENAVYATEIVNNPTKFEELPSQRDAFIEYLLFSIPENSSFNGKNGYGISPQPFSIGGENFAIKQFTLGNLGLLVDSIRNVSAFRSVSDLTWDVAPLPVYKTYNDDGTIKAKGLETGYSTSDVFVISGNLSSNKDKADAAWLFVEYLAGKECQKHQDLFGDVLPNNVELATDPNNNGFCADKTTPRGIFTNQRDYETGALLRPYNTKVIIKAAQVQRESVGAKTRIGDDWTQGWTSNIIMIKDGMLTFEEYITETEFTSSYNVLKQVTKIKK